MKPKNILIFPKAEGGFVPRLTDFGYSSASLLDTDTLRVGLSRGWSASVPECYSRTNGLFSLSEVKKMDIYCYGLVFWSTLFGEEFEKGKLPEASDFSRFSSCFSQKQLDVLLRGFSSILQDDPKDRPTMDSVLESLAEVQISRVGLRPLYPDIGQDEHDYQPTQNVQVSIIFSSE
jgi:serine/threonine protein kinase